MVLMIKGWRVMESPSGMKRLVNWKILHKWSNDEVENMDIDIFDSRAWKKYLSDFRLPNGKKLPRKSVDGETIAYSVIFAGPPIWAKEAYGMEGVNNPNLRLFPRDEKGERQFIAIHGVLK